MNKALILIIFILFVCSHCFYAPGQEVSTLRSFSNRIPGVLIYTVFLFYAPATFLAFSKIFFARLNFLLKTATVIILVVGTPVIFNNNNFKYLALPLILVASIAVFFEMKKDRAA